jgi:3-dehydrotetronate 4-kinase
VQLGCIADDFTGATDLANELVSRGLRTIQYLGPPSSPPPPDIDAVVVALKSRSIDPGAAVDLSLEAVRWLASQGCPRFYFKYCSTFDSTPHGNIGPVIEALARELGVSAVVACPAFPATGRTVYQGYLFVGDKLLNESGMEHHPLTPMTDANLVRVLQAQMHGAVGHLSRATLAAGRQGDRMAALAAEGTAAVIADAVDYQDLAALGAYCATVRLSSGGSGLGAGIALALAGPQSSRASAPLPATEGRRAIVSGSCSTATRRQVDAARAVYPHFRVALKRGQTAEAAIADGKAWIDAQGAGETILVYSTASPPEVAAQREAYGPDASEVLEAILAELADHLVASGVQALLVAGGETSGAVIGRLALERLEIGPEIDPGVPWTVAPRLEGPPLLVALKSGNFGTDDFMTKAWTHLP